MPSAGELLRNERTRRNRSLSEIATETCISKRYLEAIEVDRPQDLPGEFFYKAFVLQYAKALELDRPTTERILASVVPCESHDDVVPVLNEYYENAQVGKSSRWNAPLGVAIGLLIAVMAGGSALYALWQHIQAKREAEDLATQQQMHAASSPASQTAPQAQAPPEQGITPSQQQPPTDTGGAQPATTQPAPASDVGSQPAQAQPLPTQPPPVSQAQQQVPGTRPPPLEPGQISVDLSATEQTWVSLSSAGKTVFTGVLDAQQTKQFAVAPNAKLTTGNAAGLNVRWNGKSVGPIGPRGQVRTIVFTAENAEILSPRPKTPPAPAPNL